MSSYVLCVLSVCLLIQAQEGKKKNKKQNKPKWPLLDKQQRPEKAALLVARLLEKKATATRPQCACKAQQVDGNIRIEIKRPGR